MRYQFGCIPVILSDELVWAYSYETGGSFNTSSFSIQFPQRIVQRTASQLIDELKNVEFGYLPSGRSLLSIIREVANDEKSEEFKTQHSIDNSTTSTSFIAINDNIDKSHQTKREKKQRRQQLQSGAVVDQSINTLIRVLLKITDHEIAMLQDNVKLFSQYYRFYQYNASMTSIPTAVHYYPNGGAISKFAELLSKRKNEGIVKIGRACQVASFIVQVSYDDDSYIHVIIGGEVKAKP